MNQIELVAPNGKKIAGILASDGALRPFKYTYDRKSQTSLYVVAEGPPIPPGPTTLVDEEGGQWNSTDVEWHSLFKSR